MLRFLHSAENVSTSQHASHSNWLGTRAPTIKGQGETLLAAATVVFGKYDDKLKEMDFIVGIPTTKWQSVPLIFPKQSSRTGMLLAVDLRPVNNATIKEAWPMPHFDSEAHNFAGSIYIATTPFISGYWQLAVYPDSYLTCGIVIPGGVVISKRVLPGLANATSHFQSTIEPFASALRGNMKAWLDDINLHAVDENELLDKFEAFIEI